MKHNRHKNDLNNQSFKGILSYNVLYLFFNLSVREYEYMKVNY